MARRFLNFICFFFCGGALVFFFPVNSADAQSANYVFGTTNLLVGTGAGSNSVVLGVTPQGGAWTASTSNSWLHLSAPFQSGAGSTNVIFSYDTNPGATRSGSLVIANKTLTITQAGSTYIPARPITTLVSSGLMRPAGVAIDRNGDVYFADAGTGTLGEWMLGNNSVVTLVSSGLVDPWAVAVDAASNVYIADIDAGMIKEWMPASSNLTTLVSGLEEPEGVAVDSFGDVFIADASANAVKEWTPGETNAAILVPNVPFPTGVALDAAGNVYVCPEYGGIAEWTAANSNLTTVSSSLTGNEVAVDGSGNLCFNGGISNDIVLQEWSAADGSVDTITSLGLVPKNGFYISVAVDSAQNLYFSYSAVGTTANQINEIPYAFVDPTLRLEPGTAGNDSLPAVLPQTANLLPPFAPTSDQPWLTITGITNGVVSFSTTVNSGAPRVGFITVLGQAVPIVQVSTGPAISLITIPNSGALEFAFGNTQESNFTVLSSTNFLSPISNWVSLGTASNISPNVFDFVDANPATNIQRYYRIRSP